MNGAKEVQLGDQADECDVCRVPIPDLSKAFTKEYGGKVLSFCSEACFERYIEDPALYTEFEDDDTLE